MLARFLLLMVLFVVIAKMFWRFVDAVVSGATGGAAQQGGARKSGPPVSVKMQQCPICGTYVVPGKAISRDALTRGLRADGVGTFLGGLFNTFPYTSFSQRSRGRLSSTGRRPRFSSSTCSAISWSPAASVKRSATMSRNWRGR